jgi:hypothetical protein
VGVIESEVCKVGEIMGSRTSASVVSVGSMMGGEEEGGLFVV